MNRGLNNVFFIARRKIHLIKMVDERIPQRRWSVLQPEGPRPAASPAQILCVCWGEGRRERLRRRQQRCCLANNENAMSVSELVKCFKTAGAPVWKASEFQLRALLCPRAAPGRRQTRHAPRCVTLWCFTTHILSAKSSRWQRQPAHPKSLLPPTPRHGWARLFPPSPSPASLSRW